MRINNLLKDYLNSNGIKQSHVCDETGIRRDTMWKILQGQRKITAEEFLCICDALNINPDVFRCSSTEKEKHAAHQPYPRKEGCE